MRRSGTIVGICIAVLTCAASVSAAGAATSSEAAWSTVSAQRADAASDARHAVAPDRFQGLELDRPALERVLSGAPGELSAGSASGPSLTLSLPTPDGDFERFAVRESSVMEPGLAARHPEISTYSGTGIDEPGATVHLDLGSLGFHASVIGPGGAWYIDPYFHREQGTYVSYFGRDLTRNRHGDFVERPGPPSDPFASLDPGPRAAPATVPLRIYRLALVTDPAYAEYFGPANVTSAKVALINRVNQPYETDLAIRLTLIDDNDKLNLNTDAQMTGRNGPCGFAACYSPAQASGCSGSTLARTDTVVGQIVGAGEYDIGHLAMGVNGGGVAQLGVVGNRAKAQGCTGVPTPEGDLFAIDYVAHEMGHQFDAQHSFNGLRFACGFGNRNESTSVEPGSGSTIMAYAGICLQDDLQPHSDPYFSQRSITEIQEYVTSSQPPLNEIQSVALRSFHADGDSFTLTYEGETSAPIVRGTNYNAAAIKAAIDDITGGRVKVVGFGGSAAPDDEGFQVTFGGTLARTATSLLAVTDPSGMTGFVGEITRGGPVLNGGSTVVDSGNHAPVVTAPATLRIPLRTPFRLTGGSTDAESDPVTYTWEQNDDGGINGTALVNNVKRNGPLFRQFGTAAIVDSDGTLESPSPGENAAGPDPTRIFPDLAQIVAGHTNAATGSCPAAPPVPDPVPANAVACYSEFLPTSDWTGITHDRTMHFRLTARDGNPVAGGVGWADTAVRIVPAAGPFRVTSQAFPSTAVGGSQLPVSWDPAGTAIPPIDASQVTIRLSLDHGRTFPVVLAGATPNDGAETVTLPNTSANRARIKVEAVGNVFFDVSHADLKLTVQDDNDGDGVPNADDGCPSLPASTPTGCPEVPRTVSMRYSSGAFRGKLASSESACLGGVTVRVFRRQAGPDGRIGITSTSSSGTYAVADPSAAPGRYYAKVVENTVRFVATCGAAQSDDVTVG